MLEADAKFLEDSFKKYYFDHFDLIHTPKNPEMREFGYQKFNSGMIRHISLRSDKELHLLLMKNVPKPHEDVNDAVLLYHILKKQHSKLDKGELSPKEIRVSDVAWVPLDNDTRWIYDKLSWILRQLNAQFYRFNITGFDEPLQYTIYNGNSRK